MVKPEDYKYDYGGQTPIGYNPAQYPFTGDAYIGELSGFVYDPYQNRYVPNPRVQNDYYEQAGILEKPKKPGLGEQILPVVGTVGSLAAAQSFFSDPPKFVGGIKDLFGFGPKEAATTTANTGASTVAAAPAASVASTGPTALASSVPFSFNPAATGIEGVAGAAPGAPELLSATAVPETGILGSLGQTAMAAAPYAAGALGAVGAYDLFSNNDGLKDMPSALQGASSGAGLGAMAGSFLPGIGTAIGAGVGAVLGGIAGFAHSQFGSSKGPEQLDRDAVRKHLQENGIINDQYMLTLADGTTFDIGKDGNALLDNVGANIDGKRQRHYYDVDFSDPANAQRVAALNPLAYIIAGGSDKRASDLVGMFTNAIASSKDKDSNIASLYQQFGMDHGTAYNSIDAMVKEGKLEAAKADAFKNGLDELYGVGAYAGGNKPKAVAPPPPQAQPQAPAPQPQPGTATAPQPAQQYGQTPRPQPPKPGQQVAPPTQPTTAPLPPKVPFGFGPRGSQVTKTPYQGMRR